MLSPAPNHRRPGSRARRPQTAAPERLARAEALIAAGRLAQAGRQLDAALEGQPDLAQGWHMKGVLALMQGQR